MTKSAKDEVVKTLNYCLDTFAAIFGGNRSDVGGVYHAGDMAVGACFLALELGAITVEEFSKICDNVSDNNIIKGVKR